MLAALGVASAVALAPAGAQAARPSCPAESAAPTSANASGVSDGIACLTNQVRARFGLPALHRDARLDASAAGHSADMAERQYFSHTSPEGLGPSDRAAAQGYTLSVGENIASGYQNARAVVIGWMSSDGHCRNILSAARDLGVGVAVASDPYYTQDFGDYFSVPVDPGPANGCPYDVDLDADVPGSPPPGGPGTGPALTKLKLSPRQFRAGHRSKVSYALSEAASVRFRVQRGVSGRQVAGTCVRRTTANAGAAHCVRYVQLKGRVDRSATQGANSFKYFGRLAGKRLSPGRYRLLAVATSAGGTSVAKRARFTIKQP
jgi:uncharacterized protein YkwD